MSLHVNSGQSSLGLGPLGERPVLGLVLHADAICDETSVVSHFLVNLAVPLGEAPPLGHVDLLTPGELELGPAQRLDDVVLVFVGGADGDERLADANTSDETLGFAESSSHSGLQPIGSGARQHFVDPVDVVGVDSDPDVELVLAAVLHHVLVAANAGGLQCFGRKLLQLIGDEMYSEGEFIHASFLSTQIEDPDLGIWNTTVEPGLGVRFIFTIAITSRWTTTHFGLL